MKIGPYTVHAVEAGRFGLDGGAMFGIVPRPLWTRRIQPDERGRIPLATRCMVLESSDRLVLVDTGIGDKIGDKFRDIYGIDPAGPDLKGALARHGFSPDDVTDVILTHLHFDHCGGTTERVGDRLQPVFRNAAHYVQAHHWAWADASNPREQASFLPENYAPVEQEGLLHLVEGDVELLPGISVQRVNGHTEAQQIVHVSDDHEHLVFVADLVPTSAHLPPVWGMAYDIRPMVVIEEKTAFMDAAADGGWRLFFEHDATVESVRIRRGEKGPEAVEPGNVADL